MTIPTLHDDRIDTMRHNVMHRIERDVQRRGRRLRITMGVAAASVLVAGLGGYALSAIDGGGNPYQSSISSDAAQDEGAASGGGFSTAEPAPDGAPGSLSGDRQVITTGEVSVTVERPHDTAQRLSTWVESIGGRVDNRSETGTGDDASASLTVRVPSSQVTATIDRLKTYGTVEAVSLSNSDVTAATQDLAARIDALRLSISRLEEIMAGAGSSAELIKAESALTQRQEQLESLEAQRKGLADQVSLSALTVELAQQGQVDSVEPGGFGGGLRDGWNALVSTVNTVVELAGRALPWAAIGVIVLGAIRLIGHRRSRRSWN